VTKLLPTNVRACVKGLKPNDKIISPDPSGSVGSIFSTIRIDPVSQNFDGAFVGAFVGASVGTSVGPFVEALMGALVGASVGALVGLSVGALVVGVLVGVFVGASVVDLNLFDLDFLVDLDLGLDLDLVDFDLESFFSELLLSSFVGFLFIVSLFTPSSSRRPSTTSLLEMEAFCQPGSFLVWWICCSCFSCCSCVACCC